MNKPEIKLIETEDGTSSLYRPDINETYHSFHGARGESTHVFITHGIKAIQKQSIKVFEVGMGTGLNVWLTAIYAEAHQLSIEMSTIEPIPISMDLARQLNFGQTEREKKLLTTIHECPWGEKIPISPYFTLEKKETTLEDLEINHEAVDIIFFDAFAPSKQPEIWSIENLEKCHKMLKVGGFLNTYCAQGQFKRNLKKLRFQVESLPGAMGKKEMVRAIKT